MDQNQITVTEAVLAACFSGKASPAEQNAVERWRQSSPENESLFRDYSLIWERSGNFGAAPAFNPEEAYSRVLQKTVKTGSRAGVRVPLHYFTRVAAVSALIIVSLLLYRGAKSGTGFDQTSVATVENQEIKLADGTLVWLRNGSSLLFNSIDDGHSPRKVRLVGDGYFEVAHNPDRPFSVELDAGGAVEVLGTKFHVSQTSNATGVLVRSGKVRFSPVDGNFPVLTTSQKAVFNRDNSRMLVTKATSMNELSWHTGGLEFVSTPLSEVMLDLEKYYGVKITLENSALQGCLHTAPLTNTSLDEVLGTLEVAYGLRASKTADNEYRLSGGNCGR